MITLEQIVYVIPILGLTASIVYYAMVIRNQNRTRQAQLFMQITNRMDEEYMDAWHELYTTKLNSFEDYWALYDPDKDRERYNRLMKLMTFYQGISVILQEGFIDIRPVINLLGSTPRYTWEKLIPVVDDVRKHYGSQRVWIQQEYLYNRIMSYLEDHPELAS